MPYTTLELFSDLYPPKIREKALRGQINWSSFNFLKDKELEGRMIGYPVLRAKINNIT